MSLLEIGKSGIIASQAALNVTSNNVANANTEGYSRQRVQLLPVATTLPGYISRGSGVVAGDITRIANTFLTSQVWDSTTVSSQKKIMNEYLSELDKLLGNESTSLAKGINSFFTALNAASSEPLSMSARQQVISTAQTLVTRFNNLASQLDKQNQLLLKQMDTSAQQVNSLANSIAALNDSIRTAATGNAQPNSLLDERDQAVTKLAELVGVTVLEQPDGSMNIYLQSGQPLVLGDQANKLEVRANPNDPRKSEILLNTSNSTLSLGDNLGGLMGGLQSYQNDVLGNIMNQLGRVALAVSDQMNTTLAQGTDLDGNAGTPGNYLFNDINWLPQKDRIVKTTGSGDALMGMAVTNSSALQDQQYRLDVGAGGTFTVYDASNAVVTTVPAAGSTLAAGGIIAFNGLEITLHKGALQNGDSYRLSLPLSGSPAATRAVELNRAGGSTGLVLVEISDTSQITTSDYALSITSGAPDQYTLIRKSDGQSWSGDATDLNTGITVDGLNIMVNNGTLAAGDQFVLQPTREGSSQLEVVMESARSLAFSASGSPGDNGNLQKVLELQNKDVLQGDLSLAESYTQIVGYVGVLTAQAKTEASASVALLQQAEAAKGAVSGVNLDEEAVDLMRFQQAYSANAKVISVAQSTFDALLRMF
ncbi:flagellar hook-associated protein FlgK [Endozoicomonas arenosclerae]|uniref:flagellar hook-associated protein FlgK n=1 Tax=Endozoicomonas arenosclerae TaxID=1633495 RepID=UPI0007862BB1|nr:flagellar hook-associated protein FlgK [Endozoicomonas arenosclerae]